MQNKIGKQIKTLRKSRGLTQEQLAAALGLTCQAVSKWETGITLPDTAMLPALADFLRVSIDRLFGYDKRERERAVMEIVEEAFRGYRRAGDCPGARAVLEEGLKRFPEDDVLLNNILCTIEPDEDPDGLIAIAQPLIARTEDDTVKVDALRLMAMAYAAKGDEQACAAALEQIPELYFTKLEWQAKLLHGEARLEAARKEKWLSLERLCDMMLALGEAKTARAVLDVVLDADKAENKEWRREQFEEYWAGAVGAAILPPVSESTKT